MITYFNNPYSKVSVNTLQYLFINDVYPMVITRTSKDDDKNLIISFLPTVVLTTDDYSAEYARIEDYHYITPANVTWLKDNEAALIAGTATGVPTGVIVKGATI